MKKHKKSKDLDRKYGMATILLSGLVLIGWGIYRVIYNVVGAGFNGQTQELSAAGGEYLILMGAVCIIVWYFSLSPFSKIKQLFKKKTN